MRMLRAAVRPLSTACIVGTRAAKKTTTFCVHAPRKAFTSLIPKERRHPKRPAFKRCPTPYYPNHRPSTPYPAPPSSQLAKSQTIRRTRPAVRAWKSVTRVLRPPAALPHDAHFELVSVAAERDSHSDQICSLWSDWAVL